eukprot:5841725-Prymnesium_polylepis.1
MRPLGGWRTSWGPGVTHVAPRPEGGGCRSVFGGRAVRGDADRVLLPSLGGASRPGPAVRPPLPGPAWMLGHGHARGQCRGPPLRRRCWCRRGCRSSATLTVWATGSTVTASLGVAVAVMVAGATHAGGPGGQ